MVPVEIAGPVVIRLKWHCMKHESGRFVHVARVTISHDTIETRPQRADV